MSIRPEDEWLERRRQIAVEIGALLGVAWLAMDDDRALAPTTGARLDLLADRLSPARPVQWQPVSDVVAEPGAARDVPRSAPHPFGEALETHVKALEEFASYGAETGDQRAQADASP